MTSTLPTIVSSSESVSGYVNAINAGNPETALTYFANNIIFHLFDEPLSLPDIFKGKDELYAWFKELIVQHTRFEISSLETDGENATTKILAWSDLTRQLGVAPLLLTQQFIIQEGKISLIRCVIHPESAAKLRSALSHIQE